MSADSGRQEDIRLFGDNVVPIRELKDAIREHAPLEPVEYADIVTMSDLPTTG